VSHERHRSPYRLREKVGRVAWGVVEATAFRCSWPTWYRYRALLLRCFGAKADPRCRVRRTVHVTCPWNLTIEEDAAIGDHAILYCLGPVSLGKRSTVSQYAHLCAGTHDYTDPALMPLVRRPISVGDDAWVAADAFVGPGVTVGTGAVLGARAVAFRDLEAWRVYVGNPAAALKDRPRPSGDSEPEGA